MSRLRRGIIALLLVSLVAQASVGPVAATPTTTTPGPCDGYDGTGEYLLDVFGGVITDTVQYASENGDCYTGDQVRDIVNATSHADAYASSMDASDLRRSFDTVQSNHVDDSDAYALSIVEAQVIDSMQAGDNLSEAKTNVTNGLDNYYSVIQQNAIQTHNSQLNHTVYMALAYDPDNTTSDNTPFVNVRGNDPAPDNESYTISNGSITPDSHGYLEEDGTGNPSSVQMGNYTLINGTNVSVAHVEYAVDPYHIFESGDNRAGAVMVGSPTYYQSNSDDTMPNTRWPDDEIAIAYDGAVYYQLNQQVIDARDRVHANAMNFTEQVYANFNSSDFEAVDVASGITLYTQFNTDENTTGYYGYTAGKMGLMGIEGNIDSSWTIQYTPNQNSSSDPDNARFLAGETYNLSGTLYTDWDPNGNTTPDFTVNSTYDTSTTDETVMFIAQENNSSAIYTLNGNFTVESLTNARTGENLNSTSLRNQTRQVFKSDYTMEDFDELSEYRDGVYDVSESSGGGGALFGDGGLFDGLSPGGAAFGALIGLAAALLVLNAITG